MWIEKSHEGRILPRRFHSIISIIKALLCSRLCLNYARFTSLPRDIGDVGGRAVFRRASV